MSDLTINVRATETVHRVSLKEAFPVWLPIALLSFDGPARMISVCGAR